MSVAGKSPRGVWVRLLSWRGAGVFVDPVLVLVLVALGLLGEDVPGAVSRFGLIGILLGSVLWHELGHAVAAARRGLRVGGIYLHLLPFAYVERGAPRDELAVALAGPAASLLLAAGLWVPFAVGEGLPEATWAAWFADPLALALAVNLLMGAVNLLPALPLDGGRVLRAALSIAGPAAVARRRAALVGAGVGVAVAACALLFLALPESLIGAALGAYLILVAWSAGVGRFSATR